MQLSSPSCHQHLYHQQPHRHPVMASNLCGAKSLKFKPHHLPFLHFEGARLLLSRLTSLRARNSEMLITHRTESGRL
jgi:hypothetical protein